MMGGHFSRGGLWYCPECASDCLAAPIPRHEVCRFMGTFWARPNDLWWLAGMPAAPPATSTTMAQKIKEELVLDATSDFAVALWGRMAPLSTLASPTAAALGGGADGATTTAVGSTPSPAGPSAGPGSAGSTTSRSSPGLRGLLQEFLSDLGVLSDDLELVSERAAILQGRVDTMYWKLDRILRHLD